MDERPPRERRISNRIDIEPIAVAWLTIDPVTSRVLRVTKPTPVEHPGWIVNLSTSGAGIVGPAHKDLQLRTKATIVYEGGHSTVWIRRITPTNRGDLLYYGVELEEMDAGLREAVFTIVGKGRPDEESWRRAW